MPTNPPALIDLHGRPLRRAELAQEIAAPTQGSVRTIYSGHPAQGLTPERLAALLLAAEQGDAIAYFELAEEMEEKDLHYLSVISTRKRAVAQLPIEVEPAGDSAQEKEDAKFVEDELLRRDMLEHEIFDMLDAIGKGVSATEILWAFSARKWTVGDLKWRDPRFFEFCRIDGETLKLRGGITGNGMAEDLPGGKFVVHVHKAKSGLPIRSGLARIAAWAYMFKNFAIKDWVVFLEAYGHPVRIGKYGPNESDENKRILERALRALGTDAAAAFPETMSVEFVDRKAGTAPNDLWRSQAEYFDLQLSKAVLGQTNTTDAQAGGLGSGQAEVHNEVRQDIERADAKLLAATLNRDLVAPLVMLNRGVRDKYPRLKIGRPDQEDVTSLLDASERLTEMGVEVDAEEVRERAGVPAAKPGGQVLQKKAAPQAAQEPTEGLGGPGGGKKTQTPFLDPLKSKNGGKEDGGEPALASMADNPSGRAPDFIDRTADEALDDWEPLVEPMLASVDALIGDSADLPELQRRLAEALAGVDSSAFAELLARGSFAARVTGLARPADREG